MPFVMSAFLRDHRDEMMREWEARVASESRDIRLSDSALRDHLPELLDELAIWVEQGEAAGTPRMRAAAVRHAAQRLEHSFQLTQLIHEFGMLRATILRVLLDVEADLQERVGIERIAERVVDLARLNAGLDFAIMDAVESFVEQREHRLLADVRGVAREDLLRSAERFRALIEKSTDMILVIDAEARYRFWSPSATQVLGWTAEEVLGRSAFEFIHADDRSRMVETLGGLLGAAGATAHALMRHQHKDGSWRHLEANARNLIDDPAVNGVVVNSRDVTEQRRLEAQFRQAQKLESVGRLAGGIAHDFNNLLTVILSGAEAMKEDLAVGSPIDPEIVAEIGAAGARARDLTRQLLAFARKQVIAPVPLDLNTVVRDSQKMLGRLLREDVELLVNLDPALWTVRCDPGQVEQVILNLAVNARDAMPGGGRLIIATGNVCVGPEDVARVPVERPGDYVMLVVRDSGAGMSPEVKAHLFEPFFTTKPKGEGTGLGLATIYGIVKQSGGHINLTSEPGEGTAFQIFFPRTHDAVVPGRPTPVSSNARGTESILVVEDDPQVREVTVRSLRAGGYRVLAAASGRDARHVAAGVLEGVRLLVTDVVMPGIDGPSLAEDLRRRHPGLRVLYVSGYAQDAIVKRGLLEPGIAFLPKPFTASSLLARVRAVLDAG
jgi:two-component system, cell cycle sensor histidine kinase and response regulator CckA